MGVLARTDGIKRTYTVRTYAHRYTIAGEVCVCVCVTLYDDSEEHTAKKGFVFYIAKLNVYWTLPRFLASYLFIPVPYLLCLLEICHCLCGSFMFRWANCWSGEWGKAGLMTECMRGWVSEWVSEWVYEWHGKTFISADQPINWMLDWLNEWIKMHEWLYPCQSICLIN